MSYIRDRLKEPTTWMGFIKIASGLLSLVTIFMPDLIWAGHISQLLADPQVGTIISMIGVSMALSGVNNVVTPEPDRHA